MKLTNFVALDLETTGLDFDKDEIIEVALVRFVNGAATDTLDFLVRPQQEVRAFIYGLTGINAHELAAAPVFADMAGKIRAFIGDSPVVAHNAQFDAKFLRTALAKVGIPLDEHPFLDSLTAARIAWQTVANHRLETLIQHLGIERESAHRALPDAKACGELFWQAQQIFEQMGAFSQWHLGNLSKGSVWSMVFPEPSGDAPALPAHSLPLSASSTPQKKGRRVRDFFGDEGLLAQTLPGFATRKGQAEYSDMCERNMHKGGLAVAEAGTGTGKTLAYLIPAAIKASESGERVVISTATRALQEQLWQKDIPALAPLFGDALRPALLKGRNNYLCLRKFAEHLAHPDLLLAPEERESFMALVPWVERTTTGDANENSGFNLNRNRQLWAKVASEAATCVGERCPFFTQCHGLGSRRRAANANLVLINHALFLQDLQLDFALLPTYEHILFDEAHRLPELSHQTFGRSVWFFRLRNILKQLVHVKQPEHGTLGNIETLLRAQGADANLTQCSEIRDLLGETEKQLHKLFLRIGKKQRRQKEETGGLRYKLGLQAEFDSDPNPVLDAFAKLKSALEALATALRPDQQLAVHARDLDGSAAEIGRFADDLSFIAKAQKEDWVFWLEEPWNPHTLRMHAAPLDPGTTWADKFYPWIKSAFFTSATLAIQGNLEYYCHRMGMDAPTLPQSKYPFLRCYESPWNLDAQRRVIVAGFLPKPSDPKYQAALDDLLVALLPDVSVNTLMLYTSIGSLQKSHEAISPHFSAKGKTLLSQHADGSFDSLVELFRKQRGACLLGTQVFWEGVDLPGNALELLVIPKLPFPSPGEPLVASRADHIKEQGGNPFKELFVPEAVLDLRQGVGRLIRSPEDHGTLLLLDNRILTEAYGKSFARIWNFKHQVAKSVEELKAMLM
jgi:ATP-dependent DNA helicase DinG